ncbi:MAG: hypothetical protein KGI49_03620 [Patescibacteria group bacterium]|nr:hypothetical protein [Patescibacteria group bacterium]
MRHTLIPSQLKASMHREYHSRALAVAMYALAASIFIGTVALFPAFIRAWSADREQLDAISAAQNGKDQSTLSADQAELSGDAKLLSALSHFVGASDLSGAVQSVVDIKGPIALSSLSIGRPSAKDISVVLTGVAPTRDDMLAFQSRLERLSPDMSVDLPINELAKSSNIEFTMDVTGPLP